MILGWSLTIWRGANVPGTHTTTVLQGLGQTEGKKQWIGWEFASTSIGSQMHVIEAGGNDLGM